MLARADLDTSRCSFMVACTCSSVKHHPRIVVQLLMNLSKAWQRALSPSLRVASKMVSICFSSELVDFDNIISLILFGSHVLHGGKNHLLAFFIVITGFFKFFIITFGFDSISISDIQGISNDKFQRNHNKSKENYGLHG